jgi:hypothetical protein
MNVYSNSKSDSNDKLTKDQLEVSTYEELRHWKIAEIKICFVVVLKIASL